MDIKLLAFICICLIQGFQTLDFQQLRPARAVFLSVAKRPRATPLNYATKDILNDHDSNNALLRRRLFKIHPEVQLTSQPVASENVLHQNRILNHHLSTNLKGNEQYLFQVSPRVHKKVILHSSNPLVQNMLLKTPIEAPRSRLLEDNDEVNNENQVDNENIYEKAIPFRKFEEVDNKIQLELQNNDQSEEQDNNEEIDANSSEEIEEEEGSGVPYDLDEEWLSLYDIPEDDKLPPGFNKEWLRIYHHNPEEAEDSYAFNKNWLRRNYLRGEVAVPQTFNRAWIKNYRLDDSPVYNSRLNEDLNNYYGRVRELDIQDEILRRSKLPGDNMKVYRDRFGIPRVYWAFSTVNEEPIRYIWRGNAYHKNPGYVNFVSSSSDRVNNVVQGEDESRVKELIGEDLVNNFKTKNIINELEKHANGEEIEIDDEVKQKVKELIDSELQQEQNEEEKRLEEVELDEQKHLNKEVKTVETSIKDKQKNELKMHNNLDINNVNTIIKPLKKVTVNNQQDDLNTKMVSNKKIALNEHKRGKKTKHGKNINKHKIHLDHHEKKYKKKQNNHHLHHNKEKGHKAELKIDTPKLRNEKKEDQHQKQE